MAMKAPNKLGSLFFLPFALRDRYESKQSKKWVITLYASSIAPSGGRGKTGTGSAQKTAGSRALALLWLFI